MPRKPSGPSARETAFRHLRADDGIRTRDPHLGKVMLYQLSHVRVIRLRPPKANVPCAFRTVADPDRAANSHTRMGRHCGHTGQSATPLRGHGMAPGCASVRLCLSG